jgi:hypothetical protein
LNTLFWWGYEWTFDEGSHSDIDWVCIDAVQVDRMGYLALQTFPRKKKFNRSVPNAVAQIQSVERFTKGVFEIEFTSSRSKAELQFNLRSGETTKGVSIKCKSLFSRRCKKRIVIDTSKISFIENGKTVQQFETFADSYYIEIKIKNNKAINKKHSFTINYFNFHSLESVC